MTSIRHHLPACGLLALLACGSGTTPSASEGATELTPAQMEAGEGPAAAAVGDVDGDGRTDLVIADDPGGAVIVFRATEDGTLEKLGAVPAGPYPWDLTLADLDEDGDQDLVVANHETDHLTLLLNSGDGAYRPAEGSPLHLPVRPHVHAVRTADLDRDGHADLLVDDREAEAILVLPGRGDGTFEEPRRIPVGGDPYLGMALGDLNGDGALDLVTPNSGEVAVRLARESSRFTFAEAQAVAVNAPFAVALADVNGDGRLDLITASEREAAARLFSGDGTGAFEEDPQSPFAMGRGAKKAIKGDFDGNGVTDAAISSYTSPDVLVLFGSGEGSIRTATVHGGTNPWALAAIDLDGDGRDELVVGDREHGVLRVHTVDAPVTPARP